MNDKQFVEAVLSAGASSVRIVQTSARTITLSAVMSRAKYEANLEQFVEHHGELRGIQKIGEGEGAEYRYDILFIK